MRWIVAAVIALDAIVAMMWIGGSQDGKPFTSWRERGWSCLTGDLFWTILLLLAGFWK